MLCRGNFGEGKKYLDKLSWKTNQVRTAQCLTMVKNSLKKIRAILKTKYLTNTATMEPLTDCHNHDMDSACEDCYYSKRMNEFVDYIRAKKTVNKHMNLHVSFGTLTLLNLLHYTIFTFVQLGTLTLVNLLHYTTFTFVQLSTIYYILIILIYEITYDTPLSPNQIKNKVTQY